MEQQRPELHEAQQQPLLFPEGSPMPTAFSDVSANSLSIWCTQFLLQKANCFLQIHVQHFRRTSNFISATFVNQILKE